VWLLFLMPLFAWVILRLPLGSLVLAVFLPILWSAVLMQTLIVLGAASFAIQPVTLAAEGTDQFEAWSRAYSYFYQRLLLFVPLEAIVTAAALLPCCALFLDLAPDGFGEPARSLVVFALLSLSLSLFWSLQPGVYAVLRHSVDGAGWREVYCEGPAAGLSPARASQGRTDQAPAQTGGPGALRKFQRVVFAVVVLGLSWAALGRLMTWFAGERAAWLRWELLPFERPAVQGADRGAAWIAGGWLLGMLAVAVLAAFLPGRPRPPAGRT
jgi:hypothetical protein